MNDAVLEHQNRDGEEQSAILRDECTVRDTYHSVAGMHRQVVTGTHIDGVHQDIRRHWTLRILHADEPTLEGEEHQRSGRCPDTHVEVLARDGSRFGGARYDG